MTCLKPDYEPEGSREEFRLEELLQMCDALTKDLPKEPDDCCKISKRSSGSLQIEARYECHGGKHLKVQSEKRLVLECFIEDENNLAHSTKLEYIKGSWEQDLRKLYEEISYQNQLSGACVPK